MTRKKINILTVRAVQDFLREKNIQLFTPLDLERHFRVRTHTVLVFLVRNMKRGVYVQAKRGLYYDTQVVPSEMELANKLYQPSYLSFEYALSHWGVIPETVYTITSVTTKASREFVVNGVSFIYARMKPSVFTGYAAKEIQGRSVLMALPEKAFVDYLYFVDLKKKALYDRIDLHTLERDKVITWARIFRRPSLDALVRSVYDESRRTQEDSQ
ncbi:hypothetical protein A3I42_03300 [Candidatus Uhrbacteria bacterium RIFCSPLOWO2_02_FULL_49_11]|uniref:AbiEi antitoxin C-terminal domain-containing protein n=1 Tax=Candidatus Uhrbacteria bacterium RIFCSPLOWO2_02_FULL_49_11 TaxID=1802409 RepID=A0A1F7VEP0_9BACT|nr:MAG: hypothetical protein A3I42_03300 [Candidatus Uhrbacteria bacterium RIFCSPLOWO2_02_FULL_49_11]